MSGRIFRVFLFRKRLTVSFVEILMMKFRATKLFFILTATLFFTYNSSVAQDELMSERAWISVSAAGNAYNETLIAFKEGATTGLDSMLDAPKLPGNVILSLASRIGNSDFSIQALPPLKQDYSIQLALIALAGVQTMKVEELINFPEAGQIILEDVKLGLTHNLGNSSYNYAFDPLTDSLRFIAHFKPGPELGSIQETCAGNDGAILINNNSSSPWDLSITNIDSALVLSYPQVAGSLTIDSLTPGIYTLFFSNVYGSFYQQAVEVLPAADFSFSISSDKETTDINDPAIVFMVVGSNPDSVFWDMGDGIMVEDSLLLTYTYGSAGIYNVTATAYNDGCSYNASSVISIFDVTTQTHVFAKSDFSIYPNPAADFILIRMDDFDPAIVTIADAGGLKVLEKEVKGGEKIGLEGIKAGIYSVTVICARKVRTFPLIVQY